MPDGARSADAMTPGTRPGLLRRRPHPARAVERRHHARAAARCSAASLYVAVDRSLSTSGTAQLVSQANAHHRAGDPGPNDELPDGRLHLRRAGSGTFTMVVDDRRRAGRAGRAASRRGCRSWRRSMPPERPGRATSARRRSRPWSRGRPLRRRRVERRPTPVRVLTDPVHFRGQPFYLQIVGDRTTEERTLRVLVIVLVVGGVVALLVASGVGAAYANRALVPIRQSLIEQREALRRQREFAADASHELRTPLTVIRASVDDLERHPKQPVASVGTALTDIRDEVDHLTAMVEDLLLLARSDSGAVELERCRSTSATSRRRARRRCRGSHANAGDARRRPRAGRGERRSRPAAAARRDPRRQRHPPRARRQPRRRPRPDRWRGRGPRRRGRRPGHPTGGPAARLRPVLPGRRCAGWRDRPRARDRGLDRRAARRPDRGRQPRPPRRPVHRPACRCSSAARRRSAIAEREAP